jgi:hypothetical protein
MNLATVTASQRNRLDPRARDIIGAIQQADGQALEDVVRTAINAFVVGCRADGIYDAMKAWRFLAGPRTLNGVIKAGVGADPTNTNFVSGDYNRTAGLIGNGATKCLRSGRNNNADPQDSNHNAVYIHTIDTLAGGGLYMGAGGASNGCNNLIRANNISPHGTRSRSNTRTDSGANPASAGLFGHSRNAINSYFTRMGSVTATVNVTSQSSTSDEIFVFARNNGSGTPQFHTNSRLQFYSIGENLDLELLDTRVTAYMTAIAGI